MNKDRAIQMLERMQDPGPYEPQITSEAFDALQMAIEALKYSEVQNSSDTDTISRQDAKDMIKNHKSDFSTEKDYRTARACVNAVPPVTPKQRTGKWIKLDMHRGMADHKCTACEQECYVPTCMGEPLYAFCPNCGAKMEVTE